MNWVRVFKSFTIPEAFILLYYNNLFPPMSCGISFGIPGADPGFDQGGAPDRDRPKIAILGPQFCRILVLGPHFWWSGGGLGPRGHPLDPPLYSYDFSVVI